MRLELTRELVVQAQAQTDHEPDTLFVGLLRDWLTMETEIARLKAALDQACSSLTMLGGERQAAAARMASGTNGIGEVARLTAQNVALHEQYRKQEAELCAALDDADKAEKALDEAKAAAVACSRAMSQAQEREDEAKAELSDLREQMQKATLFVGNMVLAQTAWEDGEDVVTLNGEPVGGTITGASREFGRWWPAVRGKILAALSDAAQVPKNPPTETAEKLGKGE